MGESLMEYIQFISVAVVVVTFVIERIKNKVNKIERIKNKVNKYEILKDWKNILNSR